MEYIVVLEDMLSLYDLVLSIWEDIVVYSVKALTYTRDSR